MSASGDSYVHKPLDPLNYLSLDSRVLEGDRRELEKRFDEEKAMYVSWMLHPYAVSAAVAVFGWNVMVATPSSDPRVNALRGIAFAVIVFLLVCAWQLRDGLLARPHVVYWRMIKGLSLLYLFGLVWLVFQNVGDARSFLSLWDPALGVPLEERSYATKCALYTPEDPVSMFRNVYDTLVDGEGYLDTFVLCHVIGWFCKMVMLRDLRLTLMASVLFELYELSLLHLLPNFAECWWDSLLIDIVLCNGLGIVAGYYWLKFWKCKPYNFLGDVEVEGPQGKLVRRWKPLTSFKNFLAPLVVLASLALIELNAFFLKFILWVPPPHHLNLGRVIFWWFLGCAGTREWYHYVEKDNVPLGTMISLIFVNAAIEALICVKFSTGLFPAPTPAVVKWAWGLAAAAMTAFALIYFPMQYHSKQTKMTPREKIQHAEGAD